GSLPGKVQPRVVRRQPVAAGVPRPEHAQGLGVGTRLLEAGRPEIGAALEVNPRHALALGGPRHGVAGATEADVRRVYRRGARPASRGGASPAAAAPAAAAPAPVAADRACFAVHATPRPRLSLAADTRTQASRRSSTPSMPRASGIISQPARSWKT